MEISFGNEYGDTDYSSWAPEVRLTKSQVQQLADLAGIRTPERGTLNVVITDPNQSISVQPGYYSGGTISANVALQPGTITYTFTHVHTGDSTNGGGCYSIKKEGPQQKCVHDLISYERIHGTAHDACNGGSETNDASHLWYGIGSICGQEIEIEHSHTWGDTYEHTYSTTTYETGCGYYEGQVVRTSSSIDHNENEKLSKVEIVYN